MTHRKDVCAIPVRRSVIIGAIEGVEQVRAIAERFAISIGSRERQTRGKLLGEVNLERVVVAVQAGCALGKQRRTPGGEPGETGTRQAGLDHAEGQLPPDISNIADIK